MQQNDVIKVTHNVLPILLEWKKALFKEKCCLRGKSCPKYVVKFILHGRVNFARAVKEPKYEVFAKSSCQNMTYFPLKWTNGLTRWNVIIEPVALNLRLNCYKVILWRFWPFKDLLFARPTNRCCFWTTPFDRRTCLLVCFTRKNEEESFTAAAFRKIEGLIDVIPKSLCLPNNKQKVEDISLRQVVQTNTVERVCYIVETVETSL